MLENGRDRTATVSRAASFISAACPGKHFIYPNADARMRAGRTALQDFFLNFLAAFISQFRSSEVDGRSEMMCPAYRAGARFRESICAGTSSNPAFAAQCDEGECRALYSLPSNILRSRANFCRGTGKTAISIAECTSLSSFRLARAVCVAFKSLSADLTSPGPEAFHPRCRACLYRAWYSRDLPRSGVSSR